MQLTINLYWVITIISVVCLIYSIYKLFPKLPIGNVAQAILDDLDNEWELNEDHISNGFLNINFGKFTEEITYHTIEEGQHMVENPILNKREFKLIINKAKAKYQKEYTEDMNEELLEKLSERKICK